MRINQFGYSFVLGKLDVVDYLKTLLKPGDKILDVGAGSGTYRDYLGGKYDWSAVEVFEEAAIYLRYKYGKIYNMNIKDFTYPEDYNIVIFGDVLEHMTVADAQLALQAASEHTKYIIVAVPYQLDQGQIEDNTAEIHIQNDLTPEIMKERYPALTPFYELKSEDTPIYGYYIWTKEE